MAQYPTSTRILKKAVSSATLADSVSPVFVVLVTRSGTQTHPIYGGLDQRGRMGCLAGDEFGWGHPIYRAMPLSDPTQLPGGQADFRLDEGVSAWYRCLDCRVPDGAEDYGTLEAPSTNEGLPWVTSH
jgi:hypothetical protein